MATVHDSRAGFTLTEMVVVLAITALAFSIGIVGLPVLKGGMTPRRVASQIAEAMNEARITARDQGAEQSVTIDLETRKVSGPGRNRTIAIPGEYALSVMAGRETVTGDRAIQIRFLPDGTSSGAEILISSPVGDKARVDVNWLTGLSRVSDAKP